MTAPIVWPLGTVMEPEWVESLGPVVGSTKSRSLGLNSERPAGQLWERLAEYAENHS